MILDIDYEFSNNYRIRLWTVCQKMTQLWNGIAKILRIDFDDI